MAEIIYGVIYYEHVTCKSHNQPTFPVWLIVNGTVGITIILFAYVSKYLNIAKIFRIIIIITTMCFQIAWFFFNIYSCTTNSLKIESIILYVMILHFPLLFAELYSIAISVREDEDEDVDVYYQHV
jgi:hypothetical protein